ncbi:MAG: preprotein translocase subunit YajC [Alphaproteobacteria bacterium]|nr:preprotein translocase subunit YajC [Alphaproteobacteria bacterium]
MFISSAFATAETAAAGTASGTGMVVQLVLIMAVFYFFLIRPQQKKMKQHEQLLQTIKKGDRIITGGGMIAKVLDASDPFELEVEISSGVVVKVYRATVRDLIREEVPVKAPKEKAVAKKAANANKKTKK